MTEIKFGTDGWRAIIAKEFTTENVSRVSIAVSDFLKENYKDPSVVIGHDCRFAGKLFAETAAKILSKQGVKVLLSEGFVSTPMVSLGVVNYKANMGIVITASHNPPSYNGYKLKGSFGGPLLANDIKIIESKIPEKNTLDIDAIKIKEMIKNQIISYVDLEDDYCKHAENSFDLDIIKKSNLKLAYDPMFGAGINVMKRLLPDIIQIHDDINPGFHGTAPEPIHKNLIEFSELIKKQGNIDCGLATDGDADRIGLYNRKGEFIDSHHLILLLIHYLAKYKKIKGKVITAFSCSVKINAICKHYGIKQETVQIGFKHIAERMISENVLLGGEESGGIATKGHIPERDGIWMGLILFEFMAKSGKTIDQLLEEVYTIVGKFAFERIDLHLDEKIKKSIIKNCQENKYSCFGKYRIQKIETLDGFKFFFDDNTWLMIRPSGTEPVLRTYAEALNQEKCFDILEETRKTLLE